MRAHWLTVPVLALLASTSSWAADCPALLQGSLPELRGKGQVELCERFAGKPLVVVNTASYCGFAPQFEGLEATYKEYHEQGLEMLGVPSNDFKQESKDSAETAKVCYANYGVTFTMTEPQKVKGPDAVHLFKVLAQQSNAPKWNFYKYIIAPGGKSVIAFGPLTRPDDPAFLKALQQWLPAAP